jgi:hypothetical protein
LHEILVMPAPKLWEKLNDIAGRVVGLFGRFDGLDTVAGAS